jgi:lipoyl(octanoyl) transferase
MWSVSINRNSESHPFHFEDLLRLQSDTLLRLRPEKKSALLFAELSPVVTLGRRQIHEDSEIARFKNLGIDVVSGERGGNETWHGPGQWVGFVLTPLKSFTGDAMGVRKAVHLILKHALVVSQKFIAEAHIREGVELGIWSSRGKLVSVGIKIENGYITSGFAMNCISSPTAFAQISPCGISDARPDFLLSALPESEREEAFLKLPSLIAEIFSATS